MGDGEFRVTAIDRIAGESRVIAEVFPIRAAEYALPASPTQPRNSHTFSGLEPFDSLTRLLDAANDFVTGNQGEFWVRQFAIDHMQIGSAHGARSDTHEHIFGAWLRNRQRMQTQRPTRRFQDHRSHDNLFAQSDVDRNGHLKVLHLSANTWNNFLLLGELRLLRGFEWCKAVAAEAHFLPGALTHVGIVGIVKLLEQDEV